MEVFINRNRANDLYKVTIKKVARKWVTLNTLEKFDINSWKLDPGKHGSLGSVYPSEQHYHEEQALNVCWAVLKRELSGRYSCPDTMTIERIKQAAELLGIEL